MTDSAYYPIETLNSHEIEVSTVQVKNHLMSSVELTCRGDPGSVFLVSTMRHLTFPAQGSYTLTKALLLQNLHNFEVGSENHLHKVASTDLNEVEPDALTYFSSPNHEIDAYSTFQARHLLFLSNHLNLSKTENCTENSCLDGSGCFNLRQKCDGIFECKDGSDERGCVDEAILQLDQMKRYR